MDKKSYFTIAKRSINDFINHDALTDAAALAFYSALSLAPLVLLSVTIAGLLGSTDQNAIIKEFSSLVGPKGGEAISMIIKSAKSEEETGFISSIISLVVLAFSASAVFAQLQTVLNKIFGVKAKPNLGIWGWLRKRFFSMGIIFALAFVMLVSLIISTWLTLIFPNSEGIFWILLNFAISLGVFSLFFAAIFKYLPDVEMVWRDTFIGSVLTAILFSLGKSGIGIYLGNSAVGSAYGAAGSLIVLLVWVYYSSLIIFFGAELTQVFTDIYGQGIKANNYSIRVENKEF